MSKSLGGLAGLLAKNLNFGGATKGIDVGALPPPRVGGGTVPTVTPSPPTIPKNLDETPTVTPGGTKAPDPQKPGGNGVGGAVLGVGALGAGLLPMLLSSPVISNAISGGAQVAGVAVIADEVAGVANNLIDSVSESPVNMAIAVAGVALVAYLLLK